MTGVTNTLNFHRGYTGHEHLSQFALINMNGRMYDPLLGRFLSPDPFVQLPDFSQNFNRYSYCLNNPLVYVDPDGEIIWVIAGAAIVGGVWNTVSNWDAICEGGIGAFAKYFGVGALAGGLGAATGIGTAALLGTSTGFAAGAIIGAASGGVSGATLGGGNAVVSGGNWGDFWSGAGSGFASGFVGGAVTGGVTGGLDALSNNKNFWSGENIASGRNSFSLNNAPVSTATRHRPTATTPDAMQAPVDEGMATVNQTPMTPYQKGQIGVERAMTEFKNQGGTVYQTEVSVKVDGIMNRFDFVGIKNGKLYLFEIKNGIYAKPTINQQINLPKLMINKSNFIPIGGNAKYINFPGWKVNQTYKGDYIVIYKHFF